MTGEEMERAIEFLLQSQANSEARIARLEAAQERTQGQLDQTAAHLTHLAKLVASLAEREERNRDDINIIARLVTTMIEGRAGGASTEGG